MGPTACNGEGRRGNKLRDNLAVEPLFRVTATQGAGQ